MEPYIIFITGASGSGKTTILKTIEQYFKDSNIAAYYFDDIGVPSFEHMIKEYGSTEKWQLHTVNTWIEHINNIKDKDLIFLEGSFNPEFVMTKLKSLSIKNYLIICLHADRYLREARLLIEREQANLVNQDMENFAQILKIKTLDNEGIVIDCGSLTKQKSVFETLNEIIQYINLRKNKS